jgi:hypothetical protein
MTEAPETLTYISKAEDMETEPEDIEWLHSREIEEDPIDWFSDLGLALKDIETVDHHTARQIQRTDYTLHDMQRLSVRELTLIDGVSTAQAEEMNARLSPDADGG